jgi:hypothetical protein
LHFFNIREVFLEKFDGFFYSAGGERVGVNISEDARHWIGLLQYNPSTLPGKNILREKYTLCRYGFLGSWHRPLSTGAP